MRNKKYTEKINKIKENTIIHETKSLWKIVSIKKELFNNIVFFYPDVISHFFDKVLVWVNQFNDKIYIFVDKKNNQEIWFLILKNHWNEKKIRNIYIKEQYRNRWYLILFMKIVIEKLWTKFPYYTVPEELWPIYSKLVNLYWHKVSDIINWLYRKWKKEYIINWKFKKESLYEKY